MHINTSTGEKEAEFRPARTSLRLAASLLAFFSIARITGVSHLIWLQESAKSYKVPRPRENASPGAKVQITVGR